MNSSGTEAGKRKECSKSRDPRVQRPGVLKEPGMFEELECVQHGQGKKTKLLILKAVLYKGKAREATSGDILEGQRDLAWTFPRIEHGSFNAQKKASSLHIY